jgi:hypothetical protein
MSTYVTIIDNTGRNILGVLGDETPETIDIVNPVMITVQPQNGQFQVQLIPLFLAEFIASDETNLRNFTYRYSKQNVAVGLGFQVDPRITSQYEKIIENANKAQPAASAPAAGAKPEVIKLFEE